jgi:nicotinate-nucleotide adenylyltransferase
VFCEDKDFKGKKRIGIMGGSFDPVHNGHVQTMEKAIETYQLDMGIFLPTADKEIHSEKMKLNGDLRCKMLDISLPHNFPMYVSRYEVDYQGSTIPYTARTIEYFRHCCNEKEVAIYFIAGLDIIYHLSRWKDFDKLKTMCEFIFVRRNVNDSEQIKDKLVYLKQSGLHYTIGKWESLPISSTEVRNVIRNHGDLSYLIPYPVEQFIRKHNLYR